MEELQALRSQVNDLVDHLTSGEHTNVTAPGLGLAEIANSFSRFHIPSSPAEVVEPTDYVKWLQREVLDKEMMFNSPHWIGHMTPTLPRYMPTVSSLVTAANLNVVKTETSKAATFLEREALAMLHREVFEENDAFYATHSQRRASCLGVVTCGGTTANLQALWMARNRAFPMADSAGLTEALRVSGFSGAVVVGSQLMHYSIEKAVAELGLGKQNLLRVATDEHFGIDLDGLDAALETCRRENKRVLAVIGVAGATETGSVDNLRELAARAELHGAHFHVDAAWGGGLLLAGPPWNERLKELKLADTVVIDGHKLLCTPMGLGMLLIRDPEAPGRVCTSSQYIIREDGFDQGRFTVEGSRPASAIYLHMNFCCLGRSGLGDSVRRGCQLTRYFAELIDVAPDFELVTRGELTNILLYRYVPSRLRDCGSCLAEHQQLLDDVQVKLQSEQCVAGRSFVSRTTVPVAAYGDQRLVCLRAVLGNAAITEQSLAEVLEDQRRIGRRLRGHEDEARVETAATLHGAVFEAAARWPEAPALRCSEGGRVTFAELRGQALAVAGALVSEPGQVVAIYMRRGSGAVACMLGVLARGCVYLAVDETLPGGRVGYMLKESAAEELIFSAGLEGRLPAGLMAARKRLRAEDLLLGGRAAALRGTAGPEDFAYMIFTSGSTGQPKSVKIMHCQVLALCRAFRDTWGGEMLPGDTALGLIAYAWDMHVLDIILPLSQGAELLILTETERLDGARVTEQMAESKPRWCQATPTLYRAILAGGWEGQGTSRCLTAISSGEPLAPKLARLLLQRCSRLVNCYGLTEGTIFQSFEEIQLPAVATDLPDVSCGRLCYDDPAYGQALILTRPSSEDPGASQGRAYSQAEVMRSPATLGGIQGQIAFAGAMLPRSGYFNSERLTEEKFVQNPTGWCCELASDALRGQKVMLTGDMGIFRETDGKLVVLGRLDEQVKLHGSRVDLREVEEALLSLPSRPAKNCAAVALRRGEDVRLVLFFVPTEDANARAMEAPAIAGNEEVDLWETIYDEAYGKKDAQHGQSPEDLITNWSAYISSYSGKLWPRQVVEHWLHATCDRYQDRRPRRILEHGCGNGMLLFRTALHPDVEEVWGCDLSGEAVAYLEEVQSAPCFAHIKDKVHALHRPADNFDGIPEDHFDCVVMSAMIMYFPNMAYVSKVLQKSAAALRPGGCVYVGDCRSLELMQHFHTDVTLWNAPSDMPVAELLRLCGQRCAKEKELLISPMYWYHHETFLPGCFSRAVCLLRRGYDCPADPVRGAPQPGAPVEMTRWRYDVLLLKDETGGEVEEEPRGVSTVTYAGPGDLRRARDEAKRTGEAVVVLGIPNPRVLDACGVERLAPGLARRGGATAADLRAAVAAWRAALPEAVDCEAILEEVEASGEGVYMQAMLSLAPGAELHTYDVVFYPEVNAAAPIRSPVGRLRSGTGGVEELRSLTDYGRGLMTPPAFELGRLLQLAKRLPARDLETYGNKRRFQAVCAEMRQGLEEELPRFAMPQLIVPLDELPLGATGKCDRKRLPLERVEFEAFQPKTLAKAVPPSGESEERLLDCWKELFVSSGRELGVNDDFIEIGGHSLLAGRLVGLMRAAFGGHDFSMQQVFDHPTVRSFAAKVLAAREGTGSGVAAKGTERKARAEPAAAAEVPEVVAEDISLRLPDGVVLAARWFRPTGLLAAERMTAVMDLAPYPFSYMTSNVDAATLPALVQRGGGAICAMRVAARGCDNSSGTCADPYGLDVQRDDFIAAVEWVTSQPWSDGQVVLHGFSWGGTACLRVASADRCPAAVKAICICVGNDDLYDSDVFFDGGLPLTFNFWWAVQFALFVARPPTERPSWEGLEEEWQQRLAACQNLPQKYLDANDPGSEYWQQQSLRSIGYEKLKAPVLCAAGYLGGYCDAALRLASEASEHVPVRALVGPWVHQYPHLSPVGPTLDWVAETQDFLQHFVMPPPCRSWRAEGRPLEAFANGELQVFVPHELPLGPSLPAEVRGSWFRASGRELRAQGLDTAPAVRAYRGDAARPGQSALPAPLPDRLCGLQGGEWFSWGVGNDLPADQGPDDDASCALCFEAEVLEARQLVGRPELVIVFEGPVKGQSCLFGRLSVVGTDGTARRLSYAAAPLREGQGDAQLRLHFCALQLRAGDRLRASLSSSYWPVFLPVPRAAGQPAPVVASLELRLPETLACTEAAGPAPPAAPAPTLAAKATALRRVRAPRQAREVQRQDAGASAFVTLDDGNFEVPGASGLRTCTRGEIRMQLLDPQTQTVRIGARFESAFSRQAEGWHAETQVEAELLSHPPSSAAACTVTMTLRAAHCGQELPARRLCGAVPSLMPRPLGSAGTQGESSGLVPRGLGGA